MFKKKKDKGLPKPTDVKNMSAEEVEKQIEKLQKEAKKKRDEQETKEEVLEVEKEKQPEQEKEELPQDPIIAYINRNYGTNYLLGILSELVLNNEILRKLLLEEEVKK